MAYVKNPTWANSSSGGTPISAAALQHIEDGLFAAAAQADAAVAAEIAPAGAWTSFASFGTNAAAGAGTTYYAPGSRIGVGGNEVRLRGQVTFFGNVSATTTLGTLPTATRPAKTVVIGAATKVSGSSFTVAPVQITSAGVLTCPATSFANGDSLLLDGLGFALTV